MTRLLRTLVPLGIVLLATSALAQNSACGSTPNNPDATIAACTPVIKQITKQQSICHDQMIWASSERLPADGSPPLLPTTFTSTGCSGYVPAPALVRGGRSGSSANSHHAPLPAAGYEPPPGPDLTQALKLRAEAYLAKHNFQAAIDDYDAAAKLGALDSLLLYNRALAYHGLNNDSHAVDDFTASIKTDDTNAIVWAGLCRSRAILGKLPQALADCNTSIHLLLDNPTAYRARGLVNLKLHQYALAIADFSTAIQLSPQPSPVSLYGRGVARRASNDATGASADTSAALKLNPNVAAIFKRYRVHPK